MRMQLLLRRSGDLSEGTAVVLHEFTKMLQIQSKAQCFNLFEDKSPGISKMAKNAKLEACGSVTIQEDGTVASSRGSGTVAVLDYGISEGKLIWEMRLDQDDEESQCSCFGVATKPITNCNYESSPQLWMWRAYKYVFFVWYYALKHPS